MIMDGRIVSYVPQQYMPGGDKNEMNVTGGRGEVMMETHLLKLARFCITLAMSVSVRDVRSAGYSCIKLNREGDMMAGHIKRRNREELMRLSARSSLPRSAHLALHEAKTSFSSRGNMLKPEHDFITQCWWENNKIKIQQPSGNLQSRKIVTDWKLLNHMLPKMEIDWNCFIWC